MTCVHTVRSHRTAQGDTNGNEDIVRFLIELHARILFGQKNALESYFRGGRGGSIAPYKILWMNLTHGPVADSYNTPIVDGFD